MKDIMNIKEVENIERLIKSGQPFEPLLRGFFRFQLYLHFLVKALARLLTRTPQSPIRDILFFCLTGIKHSGFKS